MKIRANIEYPPRTYAPPELTLQAACGLLDAFILELRASYEHINKLESVMDECQEYFAIGADAGERGPNKEMQLLIKIKELLPDEN